MKKRILFTSLLYLAFGFGNQIFSQNIGINGTGAAPAVSAGLDVSFTNKGLLVPRVALTATNAAGPVAAPATSLLVYNTATAGAGATAVSPGYYYWDGSAWVRFSTGGDDWKINGNANATSGTHFLGTTNAQALDFRTNNTIRFRVANANQVHAVLDGTAALPFYSFTNNTNMGMYREGANTLGFANSGIERLRMSATEAVFNDASNNYDFRIESDGQDDMFFVDASTNRIGINTTTPQSVVDFRTTGENIWLTYWENADAANGAAAQWNHTNAGNGNRVAMGVTNYSGSAFQAAALMGLSLNGTTTGSGGIGIYGAANNESGNAVEGSLSFAGGYSGWAGYFNADVYCGDTYVGSDRRLKRNIQPIMNALNIIKQVEPVSYYMNTEKYPEIGFNENRLSYGFIAQDLEQVVPEMVKDKNLVLNSNTPKDASFQEERKEELFKVVNYTLMIPITVQAIKEQQLIIDAQNNKIAELEKMILELKNSIDNK